jgi:hypothetical protein
MLSKVANLKEKTIGRNAFGSTLGWIVAWAWAIVAGGGGLWLLWTKGPWPLTNGWFALLSGVSACPATSWFFKRYAGVTVSGYVRFGAATFFFVAGRIALAVGI